MGTVMKKLVLATAVLAMAAGSAFAADMPVKAVKAPPPAPFDRWDVAVGSALMNDYVFRGITQSNPAPSAAAYFERRYNINKDVQLYIGAAGESISFPNRAAAEIDIYGGIRPTVGMFAFDFGVWGYIYPGGQCFGSQGATLQGNCAVFGGNTDFGQIGGGFPINSHFRPKNPSLFQGYSHVNVPLNRHGHLGAQPHHPPQLLNPAAPGA